MSPGFGLLGVALVTGGASGIGAATALTFAQEGVTRMVLADKNVAGLELVAEQCRVAAPGIKILTIECDVSDEVSVNAMVDAAVKEFGRLDYCVNSAGVSNKSLVGEYKTEAWDFVIGINQRGVFFCMRAELAQMAKQDPLPGVDPDPRRVGQRGSIVNLCSVNSFVGAKLNAAYVSSKHAILGLTKTCAIDYAAQNIRCNGVAPGYIITPITESPANIAVLHKSTQPEKTPAGRPGLPNEIADVIVFLSSPRASYVNGSCWTADGGFLTL